MRSPLSVLAFIFSLLFVIIAVVWTSSLFLQFIFEPGLGTLSGLAESLILPIGGITAVLWGGVRVVKQKEKFISIPPRPSGIVGREEETRKIVQWLVKTGGKTPRAAIVGMGGTGKTTLALQIIHSVRARRKFRDGIIWLSVDDLRNIRRILHKIGKHLRVAELDPQNSAEALAVDVRAGLHKKQVLIVLDDVPESMVESSDLSHLLSLPCAILITSRYEALPVQGELLELTELTEDEWLMLLRSKCAVPKGRLQRFAEKVPPLWKGLGTIGLPQLDVEAARQIHTLVEGLPLALNIIASDLADHSEIPLKQYADDLKEEKNKLDLLHHGEIKELSVRISLAVSYKRLKGDDQARFVLLAMRRGHELLTPFVSALWGDENEQDAQSNLKQLEWRNLLERSGRQVWRLHALVREFARDKLGDKKDERIEAGGRLAHYYADYVKDHIDDLPQIQSEWQDLQCAMGWAREANEDNAAIQLALRIQPFFDQYRMWDIKRSWLQDGLQAARHSKSQAERLDLLDVLTDMCVSGGTYEQAQDYYQEAVAVLETDVSDTSRLAKTLQHLCQVDIWLGQYEKAEGCGDKALSVYEDSEHWIEKIQVLNHILQVLILQRRYSEAIDFYHNRYSRLPMRILENRVENADILRIAGMIAEVEGDYRKAVQKYEEAFGIYTKLNCALGQAKIQLCRGRLAHKEGNHSEAGDFYRKAVSLYRPTPDVLGVAQSLEGLGQMARSSYKLEQAKDYYARAYKWYAIVGHHPGQVHTTSALGEIAYIEGNHTEARKYYQQALSQYRDWKVEEPWWEAKIATQYARVLELLKELLKAKQWYQKAATAYEALEEPWYQADSAYRVARLAEQLDDYEEAKNWYQKTAATSENLGHTHRQAEIAYQVACISDQLGCFSEAVKWYRIASNAYMKAEMPYWQAQGSYRAAQAAERADDLGHAKELYEVTANTYQEIGLIWRQNETSYKAARLAERSNAYQEAKQWYQKTSSSCQQPNELWLKAEASYQSARLSERTHDFSEARVWYKEVARNYCELGEQWRQEEANYRATQIEKRLANSPELATTWSDRLNLPQTSAETLHQETNHIDQNSPLMGQREDLCRAKKRYQTESDAFGLLEKSWGQAEASYRAAYLAELLGDFDEARIGYQKAADIYHSLNEPWSQAEASYQVALQLEWIGDFVEAEIWYNRTAEVYQVINDHRLYGEILHRLSRLVEHIHEIPQAKAYYELEANTCKLLKYVNWQAEATYQIAHLAEQMGEKVKAKEHCQNASLVYRELSEAWQQVETAHRAAHLAEETGDISEAWKWYQKVAEIYQELDEPWRQAEMFYRAGHLAEREQNFIEAKTQYGKALDVFAQLDEPWWKAITTYHYASMLDLLGELAAARSKYKEALDVYEKALNDKLGQARVLSSSAELARVEKNYAEAESRLDKAQKLCEHNIGSQEWMKVELGLGQLALSKKEYTQAKNHFAAVLTENDQDNLITERIYALSGLGQIAAKRDEHNRARQIFAEALSICNTAGDPLRLARIMSTLGEAILLEYNYNKAQDSECNKAQKYKLNEVQRHRLGEAKDHLITALSLGTALNVPADLLATHISLADIYTETEEYELADMSLRNAQDLAHKLGLWKTEAEVLHKLGTNAIALEEYATANEWLSNSLELYEKMREIEIQVNITIELAEVALVQDQIHRTTELCDKAIKMYEDLENSHGKIAVCEKCATMLEVYDYPDRAGNYYQLALAEGSNKGIPPSPKLLQYIKSKNYTFVNR